MLMQNRWASQLNPLLQLPQLKGEVLQSVSLQTGANIINHLLGRKLQGWQIVRQRSAASLYDTQDSNPSPQVTLYLTSSAPVVVDILVF